MNKACNRSSTKERIIKAYLRLLTQGKHRKVTVSAVAKAAECNRDTSTTISHPSMLWQNARSMNWRPHPCLISLWRLLKAML